MFDPAAEFPILRDRIFFNHSAVSPLPARTANALRRWLDEAQTEVGEAWPVWAASISRARSLAANLLHCSADEIAFVHNTTHGLLCVANSLTWRPGDNVIIAEHEFPADVHPWRNLRSRGVAVRVILEREGRFQIEDFLERIDGRTRLIAVSQVQYSTGFRMPVESLGEICAKRDILFCVDAIQGLGAMPTDVGKFGCHFLAADGHKWLLGAEGLGILYVKKSMFEKLNDSMTGWLGRVHPADYDDVEQPLAPAAKRFEEGTHALALILALEQSLGLLLEAGENQVWQKIEALTDQLAVGLRSLGFDLVSSRREGESSGIVAFTGVGVNPVAWAAELRKRKIYLAARRGWLRASPHFYNTPEQVASLLSALNELKKNG